MFTHACLLCKCNLWYYIFSITFFIQITHKVIKLLLTGIMMQHDSFKNVVYETSCCFYERVIESIIWFIKNADSFTNDTIHSLHWFVP